VVPIAAVKTPTQRLSVNGQDGLLNQLAIIADRSLFQFNQPCHKALLRGQWVNRH